MRQMLLRPHIVHLFMCLSYSCTLLKPLTEWDVIWHGPPVLSQVTLWREGEILGSEPRVQWCHLMPKLLWPLLLGVCGWQKMTPVQFLIRFCKKLWFSVWFRFYEINFGFGFYRAMHVVLARYCYRKSSVRPSVCLSVRPSVCNVDVLWAYRLD